MPAAPLGIPHARMGSGTSWIPDASPIREYAGMTGPWMLMAHGDLNLYYDHQGTTRGDDQVGSANWLMLMAMRDAAGGMLRLSTMLSAEPFTVGPRGYPLLLQSGEAYQGEPLHDRQHPHDLFMELSATWERALTRRVGLSLYAAPVGEPALGPVAFMHRPSAENDPFATIAHHWQDVTHITFGVLTAGLFTRAAKLEVSLFNGREPDGDRYNFDFHPLKSYSARILVNPAPSWSLNASVGVRGEAGTVPAALLATYGTRHPAGLAVFGRIRPRLAAPAMAMDPGMHHGMGLMPPASDTAGPPASAPSPRSR
ncbi:MAG: hypothetical protein ACM3OH_10310 [Bacillota bacterium]